MTGARGNGGNPNLKIGGQHKQHKLTPATIERLEDAYRQGLRIADACRYAGIWPDTFYRWMRRAEVDAPENAIYRDLAERLARAEATCVAENLELVRAARETDWKAAAWLLERRHDYTLKTKTEITATRAEEDPKAELETLLNRIASRLSPETDDSEPLALTDGK